MEGGRGEEEDNEGIEEECNEGIEVCASASAQG